ncbi:hypothetical protein FOC1_g10000745, partial [Fusarium oxysporum f. sp. cubense race 1]
EIKYLIRYFITYISKTKFFSAFYIIFKATFIESNIQGGFRGARLIPLNLETIISKLNMQLRTLMPLKEAT